MSRLIPLVLKVAPAHRRGQLFGNAIGNLAEERTLVAAPHLLIREKRQISKGTGLVRPSPVSKAHSIVFNILIKQPTQELEAAGKVRGQTNLGTEGFEIIPT